MMRKCLKSIQRGKMVWMVALVMALAWITISDAKAETKQLSMGCATVGGIFYNIGSPLAQCVNKALPDVNITAEFTEGTTENLRLIEQKKMQLAIITPNIGALAREGTAMFKGTPIDFRVIVRLLPNANVWGVLAKSKVQRFGDLKGLKVAVGPASGGLGVIARSQLAANGIDYKKDIKPLFMGAGDMAEALKDGAVEASFLTYELANMVAATHKIRIIPWNEGAMDEFLKKNPGYGDYTYPPGDIKGVEVPVRSPDNGIQLICLTEMDDALVYKIAKAIVENLDCMANTYAPAKAITPEWAASELANPFHPGAIKYFKEAGLMK
jgi:TRAP transporter TAXI family solute receptor